MVSPPSASVEELEKELKDVGVRLQKTPSSTEELLNLLDEAELILCKVEQGPSDSTRDALQPPMEALIRDELLRHSDTNVKVSVASCISEITKIMAPDAPYNDAEMKEYFQLCIMAFEQLSSTSGHCYMKAISVLKVLANVRVCLLMLDLELDELIVKMFQQFLDVNSQPEAVLSDMEKIMTLVVEESEEPTFKLMSLLLSSVKMENQNISPHTWELGQRVLQSCADKVRPDFPKVVRSMGIAYHDYAEVVASICQVTLTRDNLETKEPVSKEIFVREVGKAADEQPRLVMNEDGAINKSYSTQVNEKYLEGCQPRDETEERASEDVFAKEVGKAVDEQPRLVMNEEYVINKSPGTQVNEKYLEGCQPRNETKEPVSEDILVREVGKAADEQPRLVMNEDGVINKSSGIWVDEKYLEGCQQRNVESINNSRRENMETAAEQAFQKKRGRKPNSLRKEEEGYDNAWIIGVSNSLRVPCRGKNPKRKMCNLSKDSALGTSEQGEKTMSHVFSIKKVHGKILSSSPCRNHNILEEIQSETLSKGHQRNKTESSMNPESGLNLLSVSAGHLLQTQDDAIISQRIPATSSKRSGRTSDSKGKRKRGLGNNAYGSTGDAKAKRKKARRKNVSEGTGNAAEKHRMIHQENINSTKTDGICGFQESKKEFPAWQHDDVNQKGGENVTIRHATEKPGTGVGFDGTKRKRSSTSPLKKEDHGEELVGRKIKVWWPEDEEFYDGVITGFNPKRKTHKVEYTDGDAEILCLKTERWEFVEDMDDSEATEDNKQGVISTPKWFSSTQTNSCGPAVTDYKATSIEPKKRKRILSSGGNSKPKDADSGRRTKQRTLNNEKGLAKIVMFDQEPESTKQVVKTCSTQVNIRGYKVKAENAPVLTAIFAKYGDIATNCLYKSPAVRTSLLEIVCDIVKRLQSRTAEVIISELQAIENEVCDAEAAKLEVSWLREYLKDLPGVEVGQSSSLLRDMKVNTVLVSKAAKRDLEQKQAELAAAQDRVREADSCVEALTLVAKKISTDILVREAEESVWRKQLDDLAKP